MKQATRQRLTLQQIGCIFWAGLALMGARITIWRADDRLVALRLAEIETPEAVGAVTETDRAWLRDLAWALQGTARRLPFRTDCLVRVLAARWVLRRRNLPTSIHIQAGKGKDGFTAHTWLSCADVDVSGGAVEGLTTLRSCKRRTVS